MGVVWRATDTSLGRDVAIKVLPDVFARDPERMARFEREARVLASLNHPGIAAIYGVGEAAGARFLAMELVEGDDLAARIAQGPVRVVEAIELARQIAVALEVAHEKGIIHRDLKPANVKVTPDGTVKVLDFGLAKAIVGDPSGSGPTSTPTILPTMTSAGTAVGMILGTAAYMSPEQARGKAVDRRADIWAFGCVLFECLTGQRAFAGETVSDTLAKILEREPDLSKLPAATPKHVRELLSRCLVKDPKLRLRDIGDARIALDEVLAARSPSGQLRALEAPAVAERRNNRGRLAWIVAGVATLGLLAGAALLAPQLLRKPAAAVAMRFAVTSPPDVTMANDVAGSAISPDGRTLAYVAVDAGGRTRIWRRPLGSLEAQQLAGTDNAWLPFWSPDSRHLGFFADGKLKKVAVADGSAEVICDAPDGRGGTWSQNGDILFAPVAAGGLMRVSANGGEPVEVMPIDPGRQETGLRFPRFLPDGKHFTFVSLPARKGNFDVYLGTLGSAKRESLPVSAAAPVYAEPGYLILKRNGRLLAQRFDAEALKPVGEPVPLGEAPPPSQNAGAAAVSVSANGILAHASAGLPDTQLVWLDRAGRPLGTIDLPPGRYLNPSISPDGQRMVVGRQSSPGEMDLWMVDPARAVATRFTFISAPVIDRAIWSPDGKWVAFNANRNGPQDIYRKLAGGAGDEEPVLVSPAPFKNVNQWSPDGRSLLFEQPDAATGWDLWLLPLEGERKPAPILKSRFNEGQGQISPDGHWISYSSDESGRPEVYVQSFPTPESKYQVTTSGGYAGIWSSNGNEMLVVGLDGTIQSVEVQSGASFKAGMPRLLFKTRQDAIWTTATSDFQRFIQVVPVGAAAPNSITVVINWMAGLEKK